MPDEDGQLPNGRGDPAGASLHTYKEGGEEGVQQATSRTRRRTWEDLNPQDLDPAAEPGGGGDSTQKR